MCCFCRLTQSTPPAAPESQIQLGHDVLGAHAERLATALVAEVSGARLWDGKEKLLDALAALAAAAPAALDPKPGHGAMLEVRF